MLCFDSSIEHFDRSLTHAIRSCPSYISCSCVWQQQFCMAALSRTCVSRYVRAEVFSMALDGLKKPLKLYQIYHIAPKKCFCHQQLNSITSHAPRTRAWGCTQQEYLCGSLRVHVVSTQARVNSWPSCILPVPHLPCFP
jgi:hypothetical protein